MSRPYRHAHPCASCGRAVPCDGELERNEDGEPPVICPAYHLPHGQIADLRCEDCSAPGEVVV